MPVLTPTIRRKLKYLPQAGQAPHGAAALACWNWALTGFGPMQRNPDMLFNYVSLGPGTFPMAALVANAGGAAGWFTAANQARLMALEGQWAPHRNAVADTPARRNTLHQVNMELTKLAIDLNGLTYSAAPTPYQVVMHYDPIGGPPANLLFGPNYTHWWLKIDGGGAHNHRDGLEVFPGAASLTIRRPEYSQNNNCAVYVQQLHQDHVNRIGHVLNAVVTVNHAAVPGFAHGAWVDTMSCSICNGVLIPGITRHHCRCCGRPVCSDCSPATRAALLGGRVPVANPNGGGGGPHRVCLYC